MSSDANPEKTPRYPNAGYWLVSSSMVALIIFVFVVNAQQERVRRETEASTEKVLQLRRASAQDEHVRSEDAASLYARAKSHFGDTGAIWGNAHVAREAIKDKGYTADLLDIIAGGVTLAEHGRYFDERKDGTKPTFRDYCDLYVTHRTRGESHREAILAIEQVVSP